MRSTPSQLDEVGTNTVRRRLTETMSHRTTKNAKQRQQKQRPDIRVSHSSSSGGSSNNVDIDAQMMDSKDRTAEANTTSGPLCCDFYANPTVLSRLILHQKYAAAMKRLSKHPMEASTWVCRARAKNDEGCRAPAPCRNAALRIGRIGPRVGRHHLPPRSPKKVPPVYNPHQERDGQLFSYSYRQLPIHSACQNLGLYNSDTASPLKTELENLIVRLILAYPAGCQHPDHVGRYPLHGAIRYAAPRLDVITLLLTAAPTILAVKDLTGCTPQETNRLVATKTAHTLQRQRIGKLLLKGRSFWEEVRHQAMRQSKRAADHETVWSDPLPAPLANQQTVQPLAWSQLEQRCNVLEQLLTESIRQNHRVQRQLFQTQIDPRTNVTPVASAKTSSHIAQKIENERLKGAVQSLLRQNRAYEDRIADLEENMEDLLWISSGASGGRTGLNTAESSFVVDSNSVSSLTVSDKGLFIPSKVNQPRGMFGDTSSVSPILPSSFETFDAGREETKNDRIRSNATYISWTDDEGDGVSNFAATIGCRSGSSMDRPAHTTSTPERNNDDGLFFNISRVTIMNDDDDSNGDLDSILAEAELRNGTKLSSNLVRAWNEIAVDCDNDLAAL